MGFSTTERVDYANGGAPYDAELVPRITRVTPESGSLAGGADLTIFGTGFGSEPVNLAITVGDGTATPTLPPSSASFANQSRPQNEKISIHASKGSDTSFSSSARR